MKLRTFKNILLLYIILTFNSYSVAAQLSAPMVHVNDKIQNPTLTTTVDDFNPIDGQVSFENTDVSIPGNFELPVSLTRFVPTSQDMGGAHAASGWYWNIPFIRGYYYDGAQNYGGGGWHNGKNCSGDVTEITTNYSGATYYVDPSDYWSGKFLYIPNKVSELFIEGEGYTYYTKSQVTKSNYYVSGCINNVSGEEGFIVKGPDGTEYKFNHVVSFPKVLWSSSQSPTLYVKYIQISEITDKFGNKVFYDYSDDKLVKIRSTDNRIIDIYYSDNPYGTGKWVDHVVANGKTWTYKSSKDMPFEVILPNNTKWTYPRDMIDIYFRPAKLENNTLVGTSIKYNVGGCEIDTTKAKESTYSIISPNNLKTEYTFKEVYHGRSAVDSATTYIPPLVAGYYQMQSIGYYMSKILNCNVTKSLVKKVVSGPSIDPLTWNYKYSENSGTYKANSNLQYVPARSTAIASPIGGLPSTVTSLIDTRTVTEIGPSSTLVSYIDRRFRSNTEEMIVAVDELDTNSLMKRSEFNYSVGDKVGSLWFNVVGSVMWGSHAIYYNITDNENRINLSSEIVSYYHPDGIDQFETHYSDFNTYGFPQKKEVKHNDHIKYFNTTYFNLVSSWILGLESEVKVSEDDLSYESESKTTYHSTNIGNPNYANLGLSYETFRNGIFRSKNTAYHTDGNLKRVEFNIPRLVGAGNFFTEYSNYKRGIAQTIVSPLSLGTTNVTRYNEINDDGTIKSSTDFSGNRVNYDYNSLGWLTKIDYADPKWTDKLISYETVTTVDDGISGSGVDIGSLRQTVSQGNYEKRIYHDGLLRQVFSRERDISNSGTIRYQAFEYDSDNRKTLETFPSSSATSRIGMKTDYDGLGRIDKQTRTSDNSLSSFQYSAGNKIAVTDGEGNTTTTSYLAFGAPAYEKPTLIEAPDTDDIVIDYNLFDQISSIRQGNTIESRLYDSYQQLCKTIRPETGVAAFGYNSQGQLIWRAEGTSGNTLDCDTSTVPAKDKVVIAYNNHGQIYSETYPDTTPSTRYGYDLKGNLQSLYAGTIGWNYIYDSRNNIDKETLSIDGKSYVLDWEYNSLGAVSSLKYPSGVQVDFAPNALGQPTKAGSYVTSATYYPNGQLKQFLYGNGIARTVSLDSTGRIDLLTDSKSGIFKNKLDPEYDHNDNLESLIDWVDRTNDIDNISYDGVGRLLSANGRWGTGSYSYDGLGNILSRNLNGSSIGYHYNNTLNRLNNLTGAYAYAYQYDSRGNVTNNGRYGLSYNLGQQMTAAKGIGYLYDGHNRRVRKTENGLNSYTVYSQGGQLLHRVAETGLQTDIIYLGKTLVAEVDDPTTPNVTLKVQDILTGSTCPVKETCLDVADTWAHQLSWSSLNATSCSGTIVKNFNGSLTGTLSISGLSGSKRLDMDGTVYNISLTCTGIGSSKTATATASGGYGVEM